MKKELKLSLAQYRNQFSSKGKAKLGIKKFSVASAAILTAIGTAPVELSSQIVCGNMGTPTRTTGPCTGDIGFLATYDCAFFDFDGDGNNELQIYYYNFSGNGSTAYAYIDPINNDLALFGKGDHTAGFTFPGNPVAQTWNYYLMYQDRIYVLPLTGGNGYGFITFDSAGHPAGTNHPTTGMPICCFHSALPQVWGAQSGINDLASITIPTGALDECPQFPVLPVKLTQFKLEAQLNSIKLKWQTESEVNNAGFDVERSIDGQHFETIKFIKGKGNSTEVQEYSFQDEQVEDGQQYYYRLKQIDYDGRFNYSKVKVITTERPHIKLEIFPNPAINQVNIKLPKNMSSEVIISIYSTDGRLVHEKTISEAYLNNDYTIDFSGLAAGVYYIKSDNGELTDYQKLIIKN